MSGRGVAVRGLSQAMIGWLDRGLVEWEREDERESKGVEGIKRSL